MPNMWEIYSGNTKKFTIGTETAFALGISRSFKSSLSNDVKLSIGTEIKGGLTAGMKLGREIEFNFGKGLSDKYEISWQGPHDKEVKAGKSNFYNEDQFRATAGEVGAATLLNVARNILTTKLKVTVGAGMCFQLAATILACTAAFYGTREKVEDRHGFDKDIQYDDKSVYAGSMYEAMIDGFSLIAAVLSWGLAWHLDGQKRDKPIRDKFFLNMDKDVGILLGAQDAAEYGPGAWHELNADRISFGLNADMKFDAAQTLTGGRTPNWPEKYKRSNVMNIHPNGLDIVAGHHGLGKIRNLAKDFKVFIGNDNDQSEITRIDITAAQSLFARPGANEIGLVLKDNDVTLGVTDAIDLNMKDNVVKLRKGDNFLQFADNEAVLSATSVKINGNVNINGNNFSVTAASVKIGDMECLCVPDASVIADRAKFLTEIIAQTATVKANEASALVTKELSLAEGRLTTALGQANDQIKELRAQLMEMERLMKQAVYLV
jgi:hypothetical protein